jgi:SAM-dependent methyltransferase
MFTLKLSLSGAWVVGVDPSLDMLVVAREKLRRDGQPARLVCASAEALPIRTGTFALTVAVTSLCFVRNPGQAIREAWRALRPTGRLVIGELNRSSLWALWRRLNGMFRDIKYNQAHFWSVRGLTRLLRRNGFVVQTVSTLLHFPPIPFAALVRRYPLVESWGARARSGWGAFIAMSAAREGNTVTPIKLCSRSIGGLTMEIGPTKVFVTGLCDRRERLAPPRRARVPRPARGWSSSRSAC